jgi:putative lipoprotein
MLQSGRLVRRAAAFVAVLGCVNLPPVRLSAQTITGTATYRQRIALPPDAAFEATLEDVSRADAPAAVIGRARIQPVGRTPIHFRINYDPARIDPVHRYSVRARITRNEVLLFTTTLNYPVLTQGAGTAVDLVLRRVEQTRPKPDRPLTDTYWKLVQLGDQPVAVAPNQPEPHLILQAKANRVAGSGGCNRITGSFSHDSQALSFGETAATRMICRAGMEQERALLDALLRTRAWRVHGDELELLDQAGEVVARFIAVDKS